jgi:hypothetical protein
MSIYRNLSEALGIEYIPTNEEYDDSNCIEYNGGCSAFEGKKHTEESKKLIGSKSKGRRHTDATKHQIKNSHLSLVKSGTHHLLKQNGGSETARRTALNRSAAGTNPFQNRAKVKCPHCGQEGDNNLMKRWHFDKCKQKNVNTIPKL